MNIKDSTINVKVTVCFTYCDGIDFFTFDDELDNEDALGVAQQIIAMEKGWA